MEIVLCMDCKHYSTENWRCRSKEAIKRQNMATGECERWFADNFREYGACGRAARFFEPIPPPLTFKEQWNNFLSFFSRKK